MVDKGNEKWPQFIPIVNIFNWWKTKNEYKKILNNIDDMVVSDGWNIIQSNYANNDVIYDKENKFIYINTGVQYLTSVNPNFMIINWVDKWAKYIQPYQPSLSIDCIVPQVAQISSEVSTYHIWLHPEVNIEDRWMEVNRNTILSNVAFGIATIIGSLLYIL